MYIEDLLHIAIEICCNVLHMLPLGLVVLLNALQSAVLCLARRFRIFDELSVGALDANDRAMLCYSTLGAQKAKAVDGSAKCIFKRHALLAAS